MPRLTKHAKRRVKQRTGVNSGNINHCMKKVFKHGIKHDEATGELKRLMDKQYLTHKNINNMRFYGDSLYLFHTDILITVIKVPLSIVQNLENNTDPEAYEKYMNFKKSRRLQNSSRR